MENNMIAMLYINRATVLHVSSILMLALTTLMRTFYEIQA